MNRTPVDAFLASLTERDLAIAEVLRDRIRQTAPDAHETLLWGSLSYHTPEIGGRVKAALCQITVKAGGVRLEFIHGTRLEDPHSLLRGDAKSKRHVPISTPREALREEIVELIREAAAIEFLP